MWFIYLFIFFIVLEFNDTSTIVGHFMSSPREMIVDEREEQGRKRKMNENEETEEIKHCPSTLPL